MVGAPSPQAPSGPNLVYGSSWQVGTTSALVNTRTNPYLLTSGHVPADVYRPNARFPGGPIAFGVRTHSWVRVGGRLVPNSPRNSRRWIVDVVALPLPSSVRIDWPALQPRVPDGVGLFAFVGAKAFVRVERKGKCRDLPGRIEGVYPPHADDVPDWGKTLRSVTLPYTVQMRFDGSRTTEVGDSGAPVFAERNGKLHWLGVHFMETGDLQYRGLSVSTASHVALAHLSLSLA